MQNHRTSCRRAISWAPKSHLQTAISQAAILSNAPQAQPLRDAQARPPDCKTALILPLQVAVTSGEAASPGVRHALGRDLADASMTEYQPTNQVKFFGFYTQPIGFEES